MKRQIFFMLSAVVIAAFTVAACNGDDGDDNGNGDGDNGGGSSVSMEMGEFFFDPDAIEGTAGEEITIELENGGDQLHTFTIEEGASRGDGFEDWGESGVDIEVDAGESDSISFTLPDTAGEYEFICRIPGHYESGQWGTLTVN